jgi:membrane protein implicated in regulation of membrane protease activity
MDSPEDWRWVWIIATAVFAIGELTSPGSFFMLPFAIGALVATVLAFLNVDIVIEWLVFVGVSLAVLVALRPLAHRLNRSVDDTGIGSRRLLGQAAVVLRDIPAGSCVWIVRSGGPSRPMDRQSPPAPPSGSPTCRGPG